MFLLDESYYEIKKTKDRGRGVFARKEIPAGTLIGDYTGRLLLEKETSRLEKKYGNACYSMDYNDNDLSIFPLDVDGVGVHLINHSCAPNSDIFFYYGHDLFFALRQILPGEEITIDYSFDPDYQGKEFLHPCFCGSPNCRGTMYTSIERLRRFGAFCRRVTKGQKFEELKAGDLFGPLASYPKSIKDYPEFSLYANRQAKPLICDDKKLPGVAELRRRLRREGRVLNFKQLGLKVWGVAEGVIMIEK